VDIAEKEKIKMQSVDLLLQTFRNGNDKQCEKAARTLEKIGGEYVINALIQMYKLGRVKLRRRVLYLLMEIGDERVTDTFILALQDKDSSSRWIAAEAIGYVSYKERDKVTEPLLNALWDKEPDVVDAAADTLIYIGGRKAIKGLIEALRDGDSVMRKCAAKALGELDAIEAADALQEALDDEDENLRIAATKALEVIFEIGVH